MQQSCRSSDKGESMSKRVLIVDDDPDIVEAEKLILESRG